MVAVVACLFSLAHESAAQSNPATGFKVAVYPGLVQGMKRAGVEASLKSYRGKNGCEAKLGSVKNDPEVVVVSSCDKPDVHLAFCKDRLYWTSFVVQAGLAEVIKTLSLLSSGEARGPLKVKQLFATPKEITGQAELTLEIAAPLYDFSLTLQADGPEGNEVAQYQQWAFAANAASGTCR